MQLRIKKIHDYVSASNIDAFFITNFYNILYFTGFKTLVPHEREAYVLVTRKNVYVFSDGRYLDALKLQITNDPFDKLRVNKSTNQDSNIKIKLISTEKGLMKHLQEIIREEKIVKMGFEREDLKWSEYDTFQKTLGVELVPQDRVGIKIRALKETQEIVKIQKACEIGDECLRNISKTLKEGLSEREIAWNIEKWIKDQGYEIAFDPIVAVDANSAVPHYDTKNGTGVIKNNSIILIDMGVKFEGYNSDITRMFFMGRQSDQILRTYEALKKAQEETVKKLTQEKKLREIDIYCRKLITNQGFPTYPHSTGHGVGLEVHEYPKISGASEDVLQAGNMLTIEPGIYIPGKWGMRIEDTVFITSDNKTKVLTAYPKEE